MLRIVYFLLYAAKCISESGDGELDKGKIIKFSFTTKYVTNSAKKHDVNVGNSLRRKQSIMNINNCQGNRPASIFSAFGYLPEPILVKGHIYC